MIFTNQKPDNLGAIASTLCLVHCIATPFIFIAQSCSITCCDVTPNWWKFMDSVFLVISFLAIYRSTQTTASNWMKPSLWLSWFLLFLIIVNEKTAWFPLNENLIYFPALTLIVLHLYNKKYCQCNTTKCCTNEG
ncbi:MerC mercury resistance protein [Aquimarina sp. MAR_2010_214]|uniref:MerC domain-containing protein n=1 Tax=Aquimarina sp. MAR_2010_214 TaxID=1250026 RepID=UPI000C70B065|nr:MerC domain-containing protein [Aquimarina sp. MAR_2010_214]PKV51378.1 MerC mercury resistance protein [Aquimarina sp. MAR_2010_214]